MLDAFYFTSLIVWSVALARIDFREHRLPDGLISLRFRLHWQFSL